MAAELAGGLVAGCSCPVCGSAEHPAVATAAQTVSRADEDAARQSLDDAEFQTLAARESLNALQVQLHGTRSRSQGLGVAHWEQAFAEATSALQQSIAATSRLGTLEAEVDAAEKRAHALTATLATARATLAERAQQHADSESRCASLEQELRELLSSHPEAGSVAALVELHGRTLRVLEEAREALTRHERAAHELSEAASGAEAAAASAGFASLADALGAVLTGGEAAARSSVLDTRRAVRTAATAVLAEEPVAEALAEPPPDLAVLTSAVREAGRTRDRVHAATPAGGQLASSGSRR